MDLGVVGSKPPSRCGTATQKPQTPKTSASEGAGSKDETPMEALTKALIQKFSEKLGPIAQDAACQTVVSREVREFMARAGGVRIDDLGTLEERIRATLTGEPPRRTLLAAEKKAQIKHDEWAKIYKYHIEEGKAKEARSKSCEKVKQEGIKEVLEKQKAEHEEQRAKELQEEMEYFRAEMEELRKWEAAEEAKKVAARQVQERLKADRSEQLAELALRKQLADKVRAQEEAETAARIAYETRAEFEKEEAAKAAAKVALREYLVGNEVNKRLKEEAKTKQWEEDQRLMVQYADMLEKQERARKEQLERLKAVQARQAADAASRPEAKTWIDPALIDKYLRERDAAQEAEEARRHEAIKAVNKRTAEDLAGQIRERAVQREAQRKAELEEAKARVDKVLQDDASARQRAKQAAAAKKAACKDMLEQQMADNTYRRIVAPMSATEKLINSKLLGKVEKLSATGRVSASDL